MRQLSLVMDCTVKLASQHSTPSLEGSALALFMLQRLIQELDVNQERNALSTNDIHHDQYAANRPSSSQQGQIAVISAANAQSVDIDRLEQFGKKSKQILNELITAKCTTWKFQIVASDFYNQDLQYRAKQILGAPSAEYLCKSLLMKNSKCVHSDCSDRLNSKYYLVVFQYSRKLKQQKLNKFVKSLANKSNKYYKFSLASLEETKQLTQFEYNCVSPIGIGNIPVILSHHILNMNGEYESIWIGSGSVHIKLSIHLSEFRETFPHFVADITA